MNPLKFRKKPVVVEAMRLSDDNRAAVAEWCGAVQDKNKGVGALLIETFEGFMMACTGDWVIKGVKGEFYPCRPDIFEETYEPA